MRVGLLQHRRVVEAELIDELLGMTRDERARRQVALSERVEQLQNLATTLARVR